MTAAPATVNHPNRADTAKKQWCTARTATMSTTIVPKIVSAIATKTKKEKNNHEQNKEDQENNQDKQVY